MYCVTFVIVQLLAKGSEKLYCANLKREGFFIKALIPEKRFSCEKYELFGILYVTTPVKVHLRVKNTIS